MKLKTSLLFAVALLLPLTLAQAKQPTPPSVKADTKDKFAPLADQVRGQMQSGGRFEFVTADERGTVDKDLTGMGALFDKFESVDKMDDKSKIQLYNYQSEVNAILTRRDGDREICEQAPPTGSLIPKTTCRKYSDIERDRRDTIKMKDDMLHTMLPANKVGH
ncbi:hypothetical protein DVT68_02845 [Dyella solisilvae]|uniref:Uncharacterized protein n=1 Tax=Dyella solisilvae TaxID=1920168 RepID=A0A370KAV6_9GAMM|nr:hypothetical protein [Dyella solisilvae]RDI99792.1 hypothetical protein DVT68_02845 [Dyella solisilvae]